VLVYPGKVTKLIDVITLKIKAFTTISSNDMRCSLKSIFENKNIKKPIWDVRNDADALFAHHGVGFAGSVDLQLWKNASRPPQVHKTFVSGLGNVIRRDLKLEPQVLQNWIETKNKFKKPDGQ
jgi:exonuclease 3'-5' domain-containing protein 1